MSSQLNLGLLATLERLFRCGEQIFVSNEELVEFVKRLISIYNSPSETLGLREHALKSVAELAQNSSAILDIVFEDAEKYVRDQYIDDAFPHSPNSFDVLAIVRSTHLVVVVFLETIVRVDWGIPRWAAIDALCRIGDFFADEVLKKVVLGNYPPRNLSIQDDLRIIEKYKGKRFIESVHNFS